MKYRQGFVSNSSSSSFIINLYNVSGKQLKAIEEHIEYARCKLDWPEDECDPEDVWNISSDSEYVKGSVFMDNFNMGKFLSGIGVDPSDVEWSDY